ncbi:MAG: tetratricopeptide repeat protein [Bacteroidia bacterium]|nr:tetratricopeptide repeat protein [Bacteroidia bacterium]MDW8235948.1 tetratricopeptide repeat protein [Bacteroidia bacterium]
MVSQAVVWIQLISAWHGLYERAQYYTRRQQWDSALFFWHTVAAVEGDSANRALIYQQLGLIALKRGDSSEALGLWERSLRYQPTYTIAWQNYLWLRQRIPPQTPTPPPSPKYEKPPPLSEKAPVTLGTLPVPNPRKLPWLAAERLRN